MGAAVDRRAHREPLFANTIETESVVGGQARAQQVEASWTHKAS